MEPSKPAFPVIIILLMSPGFLSSKSSAMMTPQIKKQSFGITANHEAVDLYTLTNAAGMEVSIMNYGGAVVSIKAPIGTTSSEMWCLAMTSLMVI